MQYHIVLGEKLLPADLRSGVHKNSMLGLSYWLMFYQNSTQVREADCSAIWGSGLTCHFLKLLTQYSHFSFEHPHNFTAETVLELPSNPCKRSWRLLSQCYLLLCRSSSITFLWMDNPLRRRMGSWSGCPRCSRSRRIAALPIPPPYWR